MASETVTEVGPSIDDLVTGLHTKAAKIRALDQAGYVRADIARYLGIRYQHVYNVLKRSKSDQPPPQVWVKVGEGGRMVIPAPYRRALGLEGADHVQMRLEGDEIRMVSRSGAIRRAQERVAKYVPPGRSLVDELIAERRREAAREDAGE